MTTTARRRGVAKQSRWNVVGAGLLVGMLSLTGCGGDKSYKDAEEIANALKAKGVACEFSRGLGPSTAASTGSCEYTDDSGKGTNFLIHTFSSDSNKEAQVRSIKEFASLTKAYGLVEGKNWVVNCTRKPTCEKVNKAIGGRLDVYP